MHYQVLCAKRQNSIANHVLHYCNVMSGEYRDSYRPFTTGTWRYDVRFLRGTAVAGGGGTGGGTSAGYFDRTSGVFTVMETNKRTNPTTRDLRGKGLLEYVGEHYLRFAGTKEYFLKAGSDSPENLLAYTDFDNTPNHNNRRKTWSPHVRDYIAGQDPTWRNGKGKGIVGAISYLSGQGMNAFSFLTMNIQGDDQNVYPYVTDNDRTRLDVSKLAQWEILFEHADKMGMFLHFKMQEQENDQLLDGGNLGVERKLYYRELPGVARFSHHLALNWNLGEETTNTNQQHKAFATYIKSIDPYKHPIVLHTFPNEKNKYYGT
jgi:hypothetical protein